jgi:hypothetical protein
VGKVWTLCGLLKGGFRDEPSYHSCRKLWKNAKEDYCMKEEQCMCVCKDYRTCVYHVVAFFSFLPYFPFSMIIL